MKIAVYAIAKNEEQNVKRFLDSAKDADYICILDTGSTDGTMDEIARWSSLYQRVFVTASQREYEPWCCVDEYDEIGAGGGRPFRFDEARNESMRLIPTDTDVCVCLDLDEVLCPGWREAIERVWNELDTTGRYEYVWNFREDGSDGVKFLGEKVHRYGGCRWVGAVHEVLQYEGDRVDIQIPGLRIEHHADDSKSRGSYLPMLELAVRENPQNDRNVHYLGREYYFRGKYADAIQTLTRHLKLPTATWNEERAASMRYIGLCCEAIGLQEAAADWYERAHAEAPGQREPLISLAKLRLREHRWQDVVECCNRAIFIRERPMTYMSDPYAWNEGPYDLSSVALWYLGKTESAKACCMKAVEYNPADKRIAGNFRMMEGS